MNNLNIVNIEKVVLSSMFYEYENISTAKEILVPLDFTFPPYVKVYETILKLY